MDRFMVKSIVKVLNDARKANFKFICSDGKVDYAFDLQRGRDIDLTIINKEDKMEVSSSYTDVSSIFIPDKNYKAEYIEESILTPSNTDYQKTKIYCRDMVQVFLPIFRLLNEQVVFLLKTDVGMKQMYFIHGKVIFEEAFDGYLNLYQTDLRKIFNTYQNSEIVMFDKLPTRINFKTIASACEERARFLGLKYRQEKYGIPVGGDMYVKVK